jgi:intracellular multiplication protein IcmC
MFMKYLRGVSVSSACRLLVLLTLVLIVVPVFAQDQGTKVPDPPSFTDQVNSLNAQAVLTNLVQQVPNLMRLVTAIAYVLGMYFIIAAVMKFKHFGESRTMMSHEHSVATPVIMMSVGAALLYLPTSVQVGMSTFWTDPNPYAYLEQKDQWSQFIGDCFLVIQFIGTIAFIRGLVILSHVGGQGSHGSFGKGLTHVIGGILCINIYQFVQVVMMTVGIQT